jgi:hypothetical protein
VCDALSRFIKQTASKTKGNPNVNISEVKVHTGKRKASDTAEDRYYTQAEYAALSPSQRKDLAEKRLKRGHTKGAKDSKVTKKKGNTTGSPSKEVINRIVNRTVAQLSKKAEQSTPNDDDSCGSSSTDDVSNKTGGKSTTGGNRTNPSLTRQSKKSK